MTKPSGKSTGHAGHPHTGGGKGSAAQSKPSQQAKRSPQSSSAPQTPQRRAHSPSSGAASAAKPVSPPARSNGAGAQAAPSSSLAQAVRGTLASQPSALSSSVPKLSVTRPAPAPKPSSAGLAIPVAAAPIARSAADASTSTPAKTATSAAPAVDSPAQAQPDNPLAALAARATRSALAVTYWFEPAPVEHPYALSLRFSGRRREVAGASQPGDSFVHEETFHDVTPGSGPVSVTAKFSGLNPGEWEVQVTPLGATASRALALEVNPPTNPLQAFWRRYAPQATPERLIPTRLEPFLRVPGTLPYIWMTLVLIGMLVAVVTQSLLTARAGRPVGPTLLGTLGALAVGAVGAKVWYIIKEHDYIGWCIQGMILGAGVAAGLLYLALGVPVGGALDAAAPGLMLGMVVGRIGCFFAGCCGGPPTAAWWGVWSSDQRMGARRVPTQLIEAGTALLLGVLTLVALLTHGAANGAYFAVDVAAYVLAREVILRMRVEKVNTRLPIPATAVAATLALIVSLVVIGR